MCQDVVNLTVIYSIDAVSVFLMAFGGLQMSELETADRSIINKFFVHLPQFSGSNHLA